MEIYVHATDGKGLYASMKVIEASSGQEAIEIAKQSAVSVPRCCTQWFASTEKKYINSVKNLGKRSKR
jgi:hypothetical protein